SPSRTRGVMYDAWTTISHLGRLAAIPLAGQLIYAVGEPEGYQVSLGIAFAIGLIAVYYYAQIPEHSGTFRRVRVSMRRIVTGTRDLPNFTRFVASHSTLQLGVML